MNKDNYLYIFFHTPKTSGTTFIRHIRKNFKEDEILWIGYDMFDFKVNEKNKVNFFQLNKEVINNISLNKRKNIKVVYGHCVHHDVYKLFRRPVRYITFIRKPLLYTISFYNFLRTVYGREDKKGRRKYFYKHQFLINGKIPDFEMWVREKYGRYSTGIENMYQTFRIFGYLKDHKAKSIESMINEFYFVGITKLFDNDSLFLYEKLGINKFFMSQNKSKKYITEGDVNPHTLKLINKKNKYDEMIYQKALVKNANFKISRRDYYQHLRLLKLRRNILFPLTQLMFGYKGIAKRFNHYLRSRFLIYSKSLDRVKGIER